MVRHGGRGCARPAPHARRHLDGRPGRPPGAEGHGRAPAGGRLRPLKLAHWLRLTGGIPSASGKDPLAHILFIRERHPGIYARTHLFLEHKDYLNLKLTGRPAASWDSITLHWVTDNRRIQAIDYHPRLLALAGLPREKLPPSGGPWTSWAP